jgi:hypothetical protein
VSGGCGNGLGFWRLLRRLGFLEAAAEALVSGGCGGDLLLDLHMSSFLSPVSHHFDLTSLLIISGLTSFRVRYQYSESDINIKPVIILSPISVSSPLSF